MGLKISGVPRPAGIRCSPLPSLGMLDAFGLGAQITPNPTELYDLAIVVNLDW